MFRVLAGARNAFRAPGAALADSTIMLDLKSIDLNLLPALEALLDEASVTRAAASVGIGQSAMSHSLRRLRELVGDALLVRDGRSMVLTPRASELKQSLPIILSELALLLSESAAFEPATSERRFRLVCQDFHPSFQVELVKMIRIEAPHVELEFSTTGGRIATTIESGQADLALCSPQPDALQCRQRTLARMDWVVVSSKSFERFWDSVTKSRYQSAAHVVVKNENQGAQILQRALSRAGLEQPVSLVVSSHVSALLIVARSDLFLTTLRTFVESLAPSLDLAIWRPPIELRPVPLTALWHERLDRDPGHVWFRDRVGSAARSIMEDSGDPLAQARGARTSQLVVSRRACSQAD